MATSSRRSWRCSPAVTTWESPTCALPRAPGSPSSSPTGAACAPSPHHRRTAEHARSPAHRVARAHGHPGTRAHVKLSHPRREEPRPTMPTHPARTSFAPSPATGTRRSATDATEATEATDAVASYVLDTCVLLADHRALYRFDEHQVVLPLVVVEELDRNKVRLDEVGRNARSALRLVEELRKRSGTGLREPVALPGGGSLRVEGNHIHTALPDYLEPRKPDHRILAVALAIGGTLVTKDAALRIKASQLGVRVEDYRADTVQVDEHYTGIAELVVERWVLDQLHADGKARLPAEVLRAVSDEALALGQCLVLKSGRSSSGLARVTEVLPGGAAVLSRA